MAQKYHVPAFPNGQTSGDESYTLIFDDLRKIKPGPMTMPTDPNPNPEAFHKNVQPAHPSSDKIRPQAPKMKGPLHHNSAAQRPPHQKYMEQGRYGNNSQAKPVTVHGSDSSLRDRKVISKDHRQTPPTGGFRGSSCRQDNETGEVTVPPFPNGNESNIHYTDIFKKVSADLKSPSPYPTASVRDKSRGFKWYRVIGRCVSWFSKWGAKSRPVNTYKKV